MRSPKLPIESFRHGKSLRAVSTTGFKVVERLYRPNLEVPPHAHKCAHMVINLRGAYLQRLSGKELKFAPWTVGFYPAGEGHSSTYSPLGARTLHVELTREFLDRLREACPSLDHFLVSHGDKSAAICGEIYREFRAQDPTSPLVIEGLVLQLFGEMSRVSSEERNHRPSWLSRADSMIRERFTEQLTLSHIATEVGVHPVHLAREYRRHYQYTVGEQVRRLRIDYACQQISSTENPLADIALASGFCDQSHFTVAFKSFVGTPPSVYRKSLRLPKDFAALKDLCASESLIEPHRPEWAIAQ